ncbi:hypothetical protein J5N97_023132 [Dioscorea zingiberensis]|uniref:Protein SHORTAGE IN CHIASMATA 1 n=1 Tax=Dioscorea zingiberensis TaxID=325984 RepID=A0A9D5CDB7_9LILI|nr:hypothetical protein J5N97_023132 [Dioscorea zingiberensis]
MRSRFLSTDFFSSSDETLAHFRPLSLPPPPPLPSPDPHIAPVPSFFDLVPDHSLCFDIGGFHVENALFQFLSDVVPGFLVSGEDDRCDLSEIELSEKLEEYLCEEGEAESSSISLSDGSRIGLEKGFQFEVVEVDLPLRDCESSLMKKQAGFRFLIPDIEVPLDTVNIGMAQAGTKVPYPRGVAKSIFSMEDILVTSNADQDSIAVKDGSSLLYGMGMAKHPVKLPCFEANEIVLELQASLSMKEALGLMLSKFEYWQGTYGDELVLNTKEFLGSTNMDVLGHLSGYTPLEQCLEEEPIIFDPVLDMDLLNFSGNLLLEKGSAIYPITPDGDHSHLPCSVHFQEVQILDSSHTFQIFGSLPTAEVFEMSEMMLNDDLEPLESMYESVVSSELALVDDTFKSLPEPVLCDNKLVKSLAVIVGDLLFALKPHPFSFSDGIYLDWHPLLEGTCNHEICLANVNMLEGVFSYGETFELHSSDGMMIPIDFDLLDNSPESLNKFQSEKIYTEHHDIVPELTDAKPANTQKLKDQFDCNRTEDQFMKLNRDKVSRLFEAIPQQSDLNYFLDVRRGTTSSEDKTLKREGCSKDKPPIICFEDPSATSTSSKIELQQWDTEVHQISLSDHILGLLDYIQKIYLTLLEKHTDIRNKFSLSIGSDFELLSLSQKTLMELIWHTIARESSSDHKDETIMTYIVLYAIKQLAYFLCFFGVHTAHIYLNHLIKNIGSPNAALRSLKSIIDDAWRKVEKELTEAHPSLSVIEGILRSNALQNDTNILIVANRLFWFSLNRKLSSMNIKCHEIREARVLPNQLDKLNDDELTIAVLEVLQHSHCLLISHDIILEYGGPSTSSTISSMSANIDDLPQLHFLEIKVDNHVFAKTFCEGCDVTLHPKSKMGGVSQGIPSSQGSFNHHIIEMLNFEPVEEKKRCRSPESANQIVLSYENDSSMSMSSVQSKNTNSSAPSAPDVVIIVNTQSIKKKMLISRRSSYQKILTMEKGGAQVIEREINLPLDLIFNAAVCVVWYEARNFTDNQERTEVSSITIFVEDVATNILMSLSFAFSGCIMIFEGDISFLSAIMDSSDALYAAAASLDMNLQLFCSYASETTDEIILGSIRNATKLNRSIYPAMPESETIGESFLTKFPSINPLTAHAILSSGGLLVEFLEWSHERRIQAIGKYYIPEQSMSLFSSVCRYGELGESKSVMTECSSIDSDSSSGKLQPNRKRHKIAMDSCTFSMPFGNLSPIETLNQSNEYITNKAQASQQYQSKNFCTNRVLGKNWGFNESVIGNLAHDIEGHECINENLVDEVIDQNPLFFGEKISQSPDTVTLSKVRARNETVAESSQSHRSMFHTAVHRTFPTAAEINCDTDKWPFLKFQNQDLKDEVCGSSSLGFEKDDFTVKDQEQHLKENFSSRHFLGPSSANENIKPHYSGNAFLNTIQSQRTEKGSNWTMELLHRVKEKRRMHQQSLQSDTSPGLLSSLKNKDKSSLSRSPSIIDSYRSNPSISRSPSIIDSYRYQGSNQSKKVAKQRWNKGTKTQLNSKFEEKNGPPLITPTWTPIDKRARQNLSFTRNGNEKQSKLVWRSRNSPNIGFNLRKRYRDEG